MSQFFLRIRSRVSIGRRHLHPGILPVPSAALIALMGGSCDSVLIFRYPAVPFPLEFYRFFTKSTLLGH
jgi:hypothetical protein